jgi:PAS domain S-box-containing protein
MDEPREFGLHSVQGRYGFAVLLVAIAAALMWIWLQIFLEPAVAPFLAAILLSGWYAGARPVILTAILSVVVYLFLFPTHLIELSVEFAARMIWFLAFAWLAAWFGAGRRRAAERLEQARHQLEERVVARTAALQRSEEYLVAAQRLSHIGSWAWRIQENEMTWSEECARILGFPPGERTLPRSALAQVPHPADRERADETIATALREKRGYELRMRTVRPDGTVRFVRTVARPVLNDAGEVVEYVGILMDLTARRRASRRLRRAREEAVGVRIAAVLEERTRLASELHDTLLQGFTGVGLSLVAVTNRMEGPPEVVAALQGVIASAQGTLENARRAIWDMRPTLPSGADLGEALKVTVEERLRGAGVTLDFSVHGPLWSAGPWIESAVLRIAEEAIANVVQHSGARTVSVSLTYQPRLLLLAIGDDGRGFTLDPDLRAYRGHLGLLGMRERASQARGTLSIRTAPGEGTKIVFVAPGGIA